MITQLTRPIRRTIGNLIIELKPEGSIRFKGRWEKNASWSKPITLEKFEELTGKPLKDLAGESFNGYTKKNSGSSQADKGGEVRHASRNR